MSYNTYPAPAAAAAAPMPAAAAVPVAAIPPSYLNYRRVWLWIEIALLATALFFLFRWLTVGGGHYYVADFFDWTWNDARPRLANVICFPWQDRWAGTCM